MFRRKVVWSGAFCLLGILILTASVWDSFGQSAQAPAKASRAEATREQAA